MLGRRKFLRFMGVNAVAMPLAAKTAADNAIADLALRGADASPLACAAPGMVSGGDFDEDLVKAKAYLAAFGKPPSFVIASAEKESRRVYFLEPDIASKKSWSMAFKINEQRKRNLKEEIERRTNPDLWHNTAREFTRKMGFSWPW